MRKISKEVSIVISARDHYSDAIKTMQNSTHAFNKDMDGMQQKLDALDKTKITLKTDTDNAKKALTEAQKAYEKLGDAASKSQMEAANAEYEQARRNLSLLAKEARETEKAMASYESASSRAGNKAGFGGGITSAMNELKNNAAFSQMGKMLGDSVSNGMNAKITSALGSNTGNAIGTVASGIMSGAAMGAIAGPVGAAIGAGVGLLSGGLQARTEYFTKKDDVFRGVVQDRYNTQQERINADLTAGSEIAAGREMDEISFSKLMGGKDISSEFLGDIKDMANTTPFQYEDLTQMSKVLSAYKYNPEEIKTLLTQVGDTGAALGMDASGMSTVSTGLGRMKSSGKTTLEYINPLLERGIPVMQYLAEANNVSEKAIYEMISKGKLDGTKSAQIIADAMGAENAGAMTEQGKTYAGLKSTVEGLDKDSQAAMGEGYNKTRITGLKDQIEYLGGKDGKALQDANHLVGEWKGELENEKEYRVRAAEREAMEQFESGEITGAKAGEIIARARASAEAEYMASTGMQQEIASQQALIEGIQNDTALKNEYWNTGMIMGEAFSKGLASVISEEGTKTLQELARNQYGFDIEKYKQSEEKKHPTKKIEDESGNRPYEHTLPNAQGTFDAGRNIPKKAFGMGYVPYNDFPALLHEGERVMTASENRAHSGADQQGVVINVTGTVVREEADVYAIAKEIARQVERARMLM